LSVAWSNAQESRLWVYFPRPEDIIMELRLLPFWVPELPPQTTRLYVNGTLVGEIELATREWRDYVVRLPKTSLIAGMNRIRVVYRYALSPAALIPGSDDTRTLAVAYDYLAFRRNSR
jgi:hypothetical protein